MCVYIYIYIYIYNVIYIYIYIWLLQHVQLLDEDVVEVVLLRPWPQAAQYLFAGNLYSML